jgi:ABC-type branched-subunit amino acid transport system substrate-binding protein
MLAGVELALFENGGDDFLIMPMDTADSPDTAEKRAADAIDEGADIILGPLFAAQVGPVTDAARRKSVPVVAFSTDRSAAGGGAYLASVMAEEEVARIMDYAASRGTKSFAFLGPNNAYGKLVESAMRSEAADNGWTIIGTGFYDPAKSASSEVARVASIIKADRTGTVGLVLPERGTKLLSIAPLLVVNGVDPSKTRFLGTSIWDDSAIWREPALAGAYFAAVDPDNLSTFKQTYERIYGRKPSDLAAAAYDAAAVAITLAGENNIKHGGVTDPQGFIGVNGLFRFRLDGTSERGLAVKEIRSSGASVVEDGVTKFRDGDS